MAYSVVANNAMTLRPRQVGRSDLYTWREIFRLYVEAQVFESVREPKEGERSMEDMEAQLKLFEQHIQEKKASLVLPASRNALDAFLSLNVFILDVKKVMLSPALMYLMVTDHTAPTRQRGSDSQDYQETRQAHDASHSLSSIGTRRAPAHADPMCLEIPPKASRAGHRRGAFTRHTPHRRLCVPHLHPRRVQTHPAFLRPFLLRQVCIISPCI